MLREAGGARLAVGRAQSALDPHLLHLADAHLGHEDPGRSPRHGGCVVQSMLPSPCRSGGPFPDDARAIEVRGGDGEALCRFLGVGSSVDKHYFGGGARLSRLRQQ